MKQTLTHNSQVISTMDRAHLLNQTINIEDFTLEICLDNINVQTTNNQILQNYLIVRRAVVVVVVVLVWALVMVVEVSAGIELDAK